MLDTWSDRNEAEFQVFVRRDPDYAMNKSPSNVAWRLLKMHLALPSALYFTGKKTLFVLFALSICCAAIYAAWVLPDYICQKRPEDVALVPPTEVGLPEIVRIYREESLEVKMAEKLYQSQKDLTPAIELVWKEVQMIVSNPGPQGGKVAGKRWSHSYSTDNLLMPYTDYRNDFTTMAEDFLTNDYPVHAVVVYFTAARIEKLKDNGMYTILTLRIFTSDISTAVMQIAGKKPLNRDLINDIITLMKEIIGFVRSTKSASEDDRVKQEAWCLAHIGHSYGIAGQNKDMAEKN